MQREGYETYLRAGMFVNYTLDARPSRLAVLDVFVEVVEKPSHRFLVVIVFLTFDDDLGCGIGLLASIAEYGEDRGRGTRKYWAK